jgi:hypothetical protein
MGRQTPTPTQHVIMNVSAREGDRAIGSPMFPTGGRCRKEACAWADITADRRVSCCVAQVNGRIGAIVRPIPRLVRKGRRTPILTECLMSGKTG